MHGTSRDKIILEEGWRRSCSMSRGDIHDKNVFKIKHIVTHGTSKNKSQLEQYSKHIYCTILEVHRDLIHWMSVMVLYYSATPQSQKGRLWAILCEAQFLSTRNLGGIDLAWPFVYLCSVYQSCHGHSPGVTWCRLWIFAWRKAWQCVSQSNFRFIIVSRPHALLSNLRPHRTYFFRQISGAR